MSALQLWVVVGVPAVLVALVLVVGRRRGAALAAVGVLAALTAAFLVVPGGRASATVVGLVAVGLVAAGAGQSPAAGRTDA